MQPVSCSGLKSWADTARYIEGHTYYTKSLALISLFGPRNAVRAAWARLMDRKHSYISVAGESVSLSEGVKYVTIQTPMERQMMHLLVVHPSATHQCGAFDPAFLVVGQDPVHMYWSRLNRMCPIPFRQNWREVLWQKGQEHNLIRPLDGFGLPGYFVQATEKWLPVVQQGLEEKWLA